MTLGVSLVLVAVGAILVWGVTADAEGLDVDAIGVILIVVGLVGALVSFVYWSPWSTATRRRTRVETVPPETRRVIVEEEVAAPAPPPDPP